jgi:hypothetical protein
MLAGDFLNDINVRSREQLSARSLRQFCNPWPFFYTCTSPPSPFEDASFGHSEPIAAAIASLASDNQCKGSPCYNAARRIRVRFRLWMNKTASGASMCLKWFWSSEKDMSSAPSRYIDERKEHRKLSTHRKVFISQKHREIVRSERCSCGVELIVHCPCLGNKRKERVIRNLAIQIGFPDCTRCLHNCAQDFSIEGKNQSRRLLGPP